MKTVSLLDRTDSFVKSTGLYIKQRCETIAEYYTKRDINATGSGIYNMLHKIRKIHLLLATPEEAIKAIDRFRDIE